MQSQRALLSGSDAFELYLAVWDVVRRKVSDTELNAEIGVDLVDVFSRLADPSDFIEAASERAEALSNELVSTALDAWAARKNAVFEPRKCVTSANAQPGDVVGNQYALVATVRRSESGAFWKAEDRSEGTAVFVKLYHSSYSHGSSSGRLTSASRAVNLDWPTNLVSALAESYLHGALSPFGTAYRVVSDPGGCSLAAYRSTSLADAVSVACQLCDAVGSLHACQIMLGPIELEDVVVLAGEAGPSVKLVDFGVYQGSDAFEPLEDMVVVGRLLNDWLSWQQLPATVGAVWAPIIARATALSPKERFSNAYALRKAIERQNE